MLFQLIKHRAADVQGNSGINQAQNIHEMLCRSFAGSHCKSATDEDSLLESPGSGKSLSIVHMEQVEE